MRTITQEIHEVRSKRRANLIAERARKGWTQAQAAERFGVSKQAYCNWELAKSEPQGSKAALMGSIYKRPVSELLEVVEVNKHG